MADTQAMDPGWKNQRYTGNSMGWNPGGGMAIGGGMMGDPNYYARGGRRWQPGQNTGINPNADNPNNPSNPPAANPAPQVNYKPASGMPWRPGGGGIPWRPGSTNNPANAGMMGGMFNFLRQGNYRPRWSPNASAGNPTGNTPAPSPTVEQAPQVEKTMPVPLPKYDIEGFTPYADDVSSDPATAMRLMAEEFKKRGRTLGQAELNDAYALGAKGDKITGKMFNDVMQHFFGKKTGMGAPTTPTPEVQKEFWS